MRSSTASPKNNPNGTLKLLLFPPEEGFGETWFPIVPSEPRLFPWPTGIAGAGGADETASMGKMTRIDCTRRPEFSGGSAGVMGGAETVGVFGRGAPRYKSPFGPGSGERGEPGLVARSCHPLQSIPAPLRALAVKNWRVGKGRGRFPIMTAQEVRTLPTEEKFQIMETLWEDMRERFETAEISPQLRDLLRDRRARVEKGEARLLDWDSVKFSIGRG